MGTRRIEPYRGQLVYTRGSLTTSYGVALYDYEHCSPVVDFPGRNWEELEQAYAAMDAFMAEWDMQFVDY